MKTLVGVKAVMGRLLDDLDSQMPRGIDEYNPRAMATLDGPDLDGPACELDDPLGWELGSMQGCREVGSGEEAQAIGG